MSKELPEKPKSWIRQRIDRIKGFLNDEDRLREESMSKAAEAWQLFENMYENQIGTQGKNLDPSLQAEFVDTALEAIEKLEDYEEVLDPSNHMFAEVQNAISELREEIQKLEKTA